MAEAICIGGFVIAAASIVGIDLARIARAIERLQGASINFKSKD